MNGTKISTYDLVQFVALVYVALCNMNLDDDVDQIDMDNDDVVRLNSLAVFIRENLSTANKSKLDKIMMEMIVKQE